jgi:hypothetical protein
MNAGLSKPLQGTVVRLLGTPYEKGVKVCEEKAILEQRMLRSLALHRWDITIHHKSVCL